MEDEFTLPLRISELRSSSGIAGKHSFSFCPCCRILGKLALKDHALEEKDKWLRRFKMPILVFYHCKECHNMRNDLSFLSIRCLISMISLAMRQLSAKLPA